MLISSLKPGSGPSPSPRARGFVSSVFCLVLGTACGGGASSPDMAGSSDDATALQAADVTVLMMGNSHTTLANLPAHLRALLAAGLPGKRVAVAVSPDWMFLEERAADTASLNLLRSRPWTAVVLQAQKYSSSGLFSYSTQGAEQLVQVTRLNKSLPVLFAEWPRLGVTETARIYDLHVSIATAQPACVPPVGQAWDLAAQRHPGLRLHSSDGNHADLPGAYLAALVLYAGITGRSPRALPDVDSGVAAPVQAQLRAVAADTLDQLPARRHCPNDAPLA
jgi:hypothetical protein